MIPLDTSAAAHRTQAEIYRHMTGSERVALAEELTADAVAITGAGIRHRHPDYDDAAVEWAGKRLRLGDDDLYRRVWPDAPVLDP